MAIKSRSSAFWSKVAMGLIFAVVVIYTIYHLIALFTSEELSTIVSGVTTESVTVGGDGYVFREEQVLYSANTGAVDYFVQNGGKVSKGQSLAKVYEGESSENVRGFIAMLDGQIALLRQCTGDAIANADLSALRKSADDTYFTLTRLIASGEVGEPDYQIEKMMLTLSKIRAITDGDASVKEALSILESEREKFFSGRNEEVFSQSSGYFYSGSDGFEAIFDISAVDTLDGESFYALLERMQRDNEFAPDGAFGKLAPDSQWKFVLPLDPDEAASFVEGEYYNVRFTENNNTEFSMLLEKKIPAPEQKKVLMVLYCNRLPDNFSFERCMTAQIERSSYSGIYVPRAALAKLDGMRGVYVLRGNVATFRLVQIVYEGSDYVLVAERDDGEGKYYYLGSNELIITNGRNLFDGRIVE
ncbi:MAG: hypothetical protein J6M03_02795 [Clostridia bacterium]|nr:hypothetical protein [Clostridia bacterium]